MNQQFQAAQQISQFFTHEKIPYAIIGGIALQHWGEPRFTRDVDVTILVPTNDEEIILKKILAAFSPRISDALDFALKSRVCLVRDQEGCEIDISLGIPGYEEQVINRAVEYNLGEAVFVKLCTAEDLIIHKEIAARPQDYADIESIILRQGKKLDIDYIQHWLENFSHILETREIINRFKEAWDQLTE
jgi:hypothetical protein